MLKSKVINSDIVIKDRLHAEVISKKEFMQKLIEYVTSDNIFSKRDFDNYDIKDIKQKTNSIKKYLEESDYTMATFSIISILICINEGTSINGVYTSNCEEYGYNTSKNQKEYNSIADFLSSDTCKTGLYTFENGVTMWFVELDDDELHTINVAVYFDGVDFKVYAPLKGNYINTINMFPVNMGNDYIRKDERAKAEQFIKEQKKNCSDEEMKTITECAYDEEDLNDKMIDIMYLAKYGKYMDDNYYIHDIETKEEVAEYDVNANMEEIKTVFDI